MASLPQTKQNPTGSRPENAGNFASFFKDRWICLILAAGLIMRIAVAFGLHEHFRDAHPAHLWPATDEATYYEYGLRSSELLRDKGWHAFIDSPPQPEYFNWAHFKYTGLVLYVAGGSPFTLRLLSILFYMTGVIFFCRSLGCSLPGKRELYLYTAILTLLPSTIFWSSLAIKEGMIFLLIGLLCWIMAREWSRPKPWIGLSAMALVCLILGAFRIWAGLACFGVSATFLLFFHPGRPALPVLLVISGVIVIVMNLIPNVQLLIANDLIGRKPDLRMLMYAPTLHLRESIFLLEGHTYPFLIKSVVAWILPLPLISDRSTMMRLAGIENIFILALTVLAVKGACRKLSRMEISWLCLGTIILLIGITFGTNLGTVYRTKGAIVPFLAYFAACGLPALLKKMEPLARRSR